MANRVVSHNSVKCFIWNMNTLLGDCANIITQSTFGKLFKSVFLDAQAAIANATVDWSYVDLNGTQNITLTGGTGEEMDEEIDKMIILLNRFYYNAVSDVNSTDTNTGALLLAISLLIASTNKPNARALTRMSAFESYYGARVLVAQSKISEIKFPASNVMNHDDVLFSAQPFNLVKGMLSNIGLPEIFLFEGKVKYDSFNGPRRMEPGLYKTSNNCPAIFRL